MEDNYKGIKVFKYEDIELFIGDVLVLKEPEGDSGFYGSSIGKLFESGHCDTATLECKYNKWLEVYFELRLTKDGKDVTIYEDDDKSFHEDVDYLFTRYLINKGAVKRS